MARHLLLFLVFAPIMGFSQGNLLPKFIETTPEGNLELAHVTVGNFLAAQQEKMCAAKSDVKFLKSMVNEAHKKFLKSYKSYSRFNELFETGHYDCLTGTAFFSLVLESLQFDYKIIETNYHIFLLIETREGNVLLETTDRLFGFKTHSQEVAKSLDAYRKNQLTSTSSQNRTYYRYQVNLFREVKSNQLTGLLYFNQAVVAFNNHEWIACVDRLEKAKYNYDNPRVEELSEILANSIAFSNLDEKVKQSLLIQLGQLATEFQILAIR